ncbi:HNH endonuclease [Paenibacillus sp. UKAQ_18]|nr:HNH endonuclease [Paenibacillus sp. UKAQ_18]
MDKTINIRGKKIIVDEDVYDVIFPMKNRIFIQGNGYAKIYVGSTNGVSKFEMLHRFILKAPENVDVDHINLNKLDNRRENLRLATKSQNQVNQPSRGGTSNYKGVFRYKSKTKSCGKIYIYEYWCAKLMKNGKCVFKKSFKNERAAALAYDEAAIEHYGEFAHLNFPQGEMRL